MDFVGVIFVCTALATSPTQCYVTFTLNPLPSELDCAAKIDDDHKAGVFADISDAGEPMDMATFYCVEWLGDVS